MKIDEPLCKLFINFYFYFEYNTLIIRIMTNSNFSFAAPAKIFLPDKPYHFPEIPVVSFVVIDVIIAFK